MEGRARSIRCGRHGRSPSRYVGVQTYWRDRATHWRRTSAVLYDSRSVDVLVCWRAVSHRPRDRSTRSAYTVCALAVTSRWMSCETEKSLAMSTPSTFRQRLRVIPGSGAGFSTLLPLRRLSLKITSQDLLQFNRRLFRSAHA